MRVALVHPSGPRHALFQLDAYCSQPQKGPFRWHPIEFLVFSGCWGKEAHVRIFDWGLGRPRNFAAQLKQFDIVIGLIGAYGWQSHLTFWRTVLQNSRAKLYLSGDVARHGPKHVFEHLPGLAGILPELTCPPPINVLSTQTSHPYVWRPDQATYKLPMAEKGFHCGVQDFGLFKQSIYHLPFGNKSPWASTYTQTGCPYTCDYCIVGSYKWAPRDLKEFDAELNALKTAGVKHLYVRDATFNTTPSHTQACIAILERNGLPWNTFARIEGSGALAPALAKAGCTTLQFGLDSIDSNILHQHNKQLRTTDIASEVRAVRAAGIQTVGHFVAGLSVQDSPAAIARYAKELGLDWITITPLMKRPGTAQWTERDYDCMDELAVPNKRLDLLTGHLSFYVTKPSFVSLIRSYGQAWTWHQINRFKS